MPGGNQELLQWVLHGREERNLEYVGSVTWEDNNIQAKIAKTALSMSNIPDGGVIVVGVEKKEEDYLPTGLSSDHFASFKQDDVSSFVNEYADPYVELTVSGVKHEGAAFIVIQVQAFSETPVICRKDGPRNLRRGVVYTRTRRMHECAQVPSQVEMREILERATEKGIQRFLERARSAGLAADQSVASDEELFSRQIEGL